MATDETKTGWTYGEMLSYFDSEVHDMPFLLIKWVWGLNIDKLVFIACLV
jgi:hypothetical protein